MYLCYLDESGTPDRSGNTVHFVLLGIAIPASTWKAKDAAVQAIKQKYGLQDAEIHTAWMLRDYPEQTSLAQFSALNMPDRRRAVRAAQVLKLARTSNRKQTRALTVAFAKTDAYIHLTRVERQSCVAELADLIGTWGDTTIFADAVNKQHANPQDNHYEFAFAQVVTRFNTFLQRQAGMLGLLVQDNNETEAGRLTKAMRGFHAKGTLWRSIDRVIETPFFVDSELTTMIQVADLCAFATRRFFDKNERELYDKIRSRFDRRAAQLVGLRHFTARFVCKCEVCIEHGRPINQTKT